MVQNSTQKVQKTLKQAGFTMIELLVVIAILGILAGISLSMLRDYRERAGVAATATEIKLFSSAFVAYHIDHEEFPPDTHGNLPAGMEKFIANHLWTEATPLGGQYNWEGPDNYSYAGISIFNHTASQRAILILDRMLDNGDVNTGKFRVMSNGRPTYVIEE
jgi:prepilin-type N-terminal cleavage/methylation domain-containing protein